MCRIAERTTEALVELGHRGRASNMPGRSDHCGRALGKGDAGTSKVLRTAGTGYPGSPRRSAGRASEISDGGPWEAMSVRSVRSAEKMTAG